MHYDGSTFGGTPVKTYTNDYIRDTGILAHGIFGSFIISYGVAQRYWYNDLSISYRRRTRYDYQPLMMTYVQNNLYLRFETDMAIKGWNKSHMSDVSASRHDVEFDLGTGSGSGIEIGIFLPGQLFATHVYLSYHKWAFKASNAVSDGVDNLIEPENNTQTVQVGLGIAL